MSEQNQLAISPVTAGLVGAAAGAGVGFIPGVAPIAKGYKTTSELLTLEKDKFEALKSKVEASDNADAKAEFKKLADGRTTISEAGDALVKEQSDARKAMNEAILRQANETDAAKKLNIDVSAEKTALDTTENAVEDLRKKMGGIEIQKDATTGQLSITHDNGADAAIQAKRNELRQARKTAREALVNKQDEGLGKKLKDAQDELAKITDTNSDAYKAKQKEIVKIENEISAEVTKNADVKRAKEALNVERKKVLTDDAVRPFKERNAKRQALDNKLVSSADEALKDVTADKNAAEGTLAKLKSQIADWKATLAKKADDVRTAKAGELVGENGALKDLDVKKFSSFLERSKGKAAAIGAAALGAAGVALAYIVGPKNEVPTDVA